MPEYEAALNVLTDIWAEVLQRKREAISPDDSFFGIGGDSLKALWMIDRAAERGLGFTPRQVFASPVLGELAALAAALPAAAPQDPGPEPAAEPSRLSRAQEWMAGHDHPSLNVHTLLRWGGDLSVPLLERSLRWLTERHAALRTVFPRDGERPVARVLPVVRVAVRTADLRGGERAVTVQDALPRAGERVREPFDLAVGPLLRLDALRLAAREWLLVLVVHHLNTDGWSMGVLADELLACYRALERGEQPPRLPQARPYAEFGAGEDTRHLPYWQRRLAGAQPLFGGGNTMSLPSLQHTFAVPESAVAAVRSAARTGTPASVVPLTALAVALERMTGRSDLVIGTSVSNRGTQDFARTVGFFANTLWLRLDLRGSEDLRDRLGAVRDSYLDGLAHSLPIEALFETGADYGQVLFNYIDMPLDTGDRDVEPVPVSLAVAEQYQDLFLTLVDDGRSLHGLLTHTTRWCTPERAGRLVEELIRVLHELGEA
ncbi:condensation domain-containing protein [Streptomyces sp. NPDC001389]|uniref:condensation domain-containing protein n=1 Tax=unclassified Streptomyces TaxID=2593676 RepID=UPI0036A6237E